MTTDDRELVAEFRAGQYEAGVQLMEQNWSALVEVARPTLGGNWHDAEDAVGDALEAMARSADTIRNVRGWLRSAVRNKAVDQVRRRCPEPVAEVEEPPAAQSGGEALVDGRSAVRSVLQALGETEQRVMARFVDDRTAGQLLSQHARALDMDLYREYKPALSCARRQADEALFLVQLLQKDPPCQELLLTCRITPGQQGPQVKLSPQGREAGLGHIGQCEQCEAYPGIRDKRHRWLGVGWFAPSPQLYDRIREICDAQRLRTETERPRRQTPRNTPAPDTDAHQGSVGGGTFRATGWDGAPEAVTQPRRRPGHRSGTVLAASLLAVVAAAVAANKSGANIALPDISNIPGVHAIAGSGGTGEGSTSGTTGGTTGGTSGGNDGSTAGGTSGGATGGNHGGTFGSTTSGTSGGNDGGTTGGGTSGGTTGGNDGGATGGISGGNDGGTSSGTTGGTSGDTFGGSDGGTSGSSSAGNTTSGTVGGTSGGETAEDTTGPSVSLAGVSAEQVGQELLEGGHFVQVCGPAGTPSTFSVWVTVSDPSGIQSVQLTVHHPDDAAFTTGSWVMDGGKARFDVPAYRSEPKAENTVQLQLSVAATDTLGNRTDADLRSPALRECGEPG
ncbi:RNA polymerase sigma factor [Streptomyces adustus]|uniref:RNA polymerase sigma factor n=1 Tax=Streptomyces adustus TaxID=1609272 RepID=UPI0035DFDE10